MKQHQKWIWIDSKKYPNNQNTVLSGFCNKENGNYTVVEFVKKYHFVKKIKKAVLTYSADTEFRLLCNGQFVATGPANVAGDFFAKETEKSTYYAFESTIYPESSTLDFYARVKMMPVGMNEFSKGHGGFMLTAKLDFEDDTQIEIGTDESWLSRKNNAYISPNEYDASIKTDEYDVSQVIDDIWNCKIAPIAPRTEKQVEKNQFTVSGNCIVNKEFDFEKLYAGFVTLSVKAQGRLNVMVECLETEQVSCSEKFTFVADDEYVGLQLRSIGRYRVLAENLSKSDAEICLSVTDTYYPIEYCAHTTVSDKALDKVLRVCENSLKICRQNMHLDSPMHCEPHACTGDYYIEMLMTAFSYGDMRLAEFDITRTAEIIRNQDGVMFHTTYSMIWIQMLYDAYMYTANRQLLEDCEEALVILLNRFETYLGENGILETPPSYMFVDWLLVDGFSIHHPPKALGQTCLNMFYYGGLMTASKIFEVFGNDELSKKYVAHARKLKTNINRLLYDKERKMYFEGLGDTTKEELINDFMPQNVKKRYYRKHANVLAVCFGVCKGNGADLLRRVLDNSSLGVFQPYFAHFVLEAIRRERLCEEYTLKILNDWKKPVLECSKGLPEGFYKPEPGYVFDYSHAWAGTPLYSLPMALSGLEILEAGFKKIRLEPKLLGLSSATVEIPTCKGLIRIDMENNKKPIITLPDGVELCS